MKADRIPEPIKTVFSCYRCDTTEHDYLFCPLTTEEVRSSNIGYMPASSGSEAFRGGSSSAGPPPNGTIILTKQFRHPAMPSLDPPIQLITPSAHFRSILSWIKLTDWWCMSFKEYIQKMNCILAMYPTATFKLFPDHSCELTVRTMNSPEELRYLAGAIRIMERVGPVPFLGYIGPYNPFYELDDPGMIERTYQRRLLERGRLDSHPAGSSNRVLPLFHQGNTTTSDFSNNGSTARLDGASFLNMISQNLFGNGNGGNRFPQLGVRPGRMQTVNTDGHQLHHASRVQQDSPMLDSCSAEFPPQIATNSQRMDGSLSSLADQSDNNPRPLREEYSTLTKVPTQSSSSKGVRSHMTSPDENSFDDASSETDEQAEWSPTPVHRNITRLKHASKTVCEVSRCDTNTPEYN